jgi:hypothetical protein
VLFIFFAGSPFTGTDYLVLSYCFFFYLDRELTVAFLLDPPRSNNCVSGNKEFSVRLAVLKTKPRRASPASKCRAG